jgi:hypothetical protein
MEEFLVYTQRIELLGNSASYDFILFTRSFRLVQYPSRLYCREKPNVAIHYNFHTVTSLEVIDVLGFTPQIYRAWREISAFWHVGRYLDGRFSDIEYYNSTKPGQFTRFPFNFHLYRPSRDVWLFERMNLFNAVAAVIFGLDVHIHKIRYRILTFQHLIVSIQSII